jgi:hypothetical protein
MTFYESLGTKPVPREQIEVGARYQFLSEDGWKNTFDREHGLVQEIRESTVIFRKGLERWSAWFSEVYPEDTLDSPKEF